MLLAGWISCQSVTSEESKTQSELIAMQNSHRVASYAEASSLYLWLQDKEGNVKKMSVRNEDVASVKEEHGQLTISFKDGSRAVFYFVAYIDVTMSANELPMAKCDSATVMFTIKTEEPEKLKIEVLNATNVNATVQFAEGKTAGVVSFILKGLESFKEDVVVRFDNGQYKVEETISISRINFGWDDGKDSKLYYTVGDGESIELGLMGGIDYIVENSCDWVEIIDAKQNLLEIRFLENDGKKRKTEIRLKSEDGSVVTLSVIQTVSQRAILMKLYEATNGDNWKDNSNWGSDLPLDEWFGVEAIGGHVTKIYLEGNHLDGYLPDEIYDLLFLEYLILGSPKHSNTLNDWDIDDWNIIRGEISPKIGQLTHLEVLDFQGLIDITCGDVPDEIWMPQIELINLNKVSIKGRLSSAIGNATNLKHLNISNNWGKTDLRGTLPTEIAKLKNLEFLNLEGNRHLTGTLPENIGDMESLQYVNLRICALTGTIPESIFKLKNLCDFDVCANFLEGEFSLSRLVELPNMDFIAIDTNNYLQGIGEVPDFIRHVKFDRDGKRSTYEYGKMEYAYESIYNTSEMLAERLADE